jgi:hypothetical protein
VTDILEKAGIGPGGETFRSKTSTVDGVKIEDWTPKE